MRIGAVIAARYSSTRFPGKVLEKIGPMNMLEHVRQRCFAVEERFPVYVVATAEDKGRIPADLYVNNPAENVLGRFIAAANTFHLDAVVRVTSDCPLVDPAAIVRALTVFRSGHFDFVANDRSAVSRFPDGMGVEVFKSYMLDYVSAGNPTPADLEHVSSWMLRYAKHFHIADIACPYPGTSHLKLSVDTPEDLERVRKIYEFLPAINPTSLESILWTLNRLRQMNADLPKKD